MYKLVWCVVCVDRMIGVRIEDRDECVCVLERDMYVEKEIDSERKKHEHDTKGIDKNPS